MPKTEKTAYFIVEGRCTECRIVKEHTLSGSVIVQRISDNNCFQVSACDERL